MRSIVWKSKLHQPSADNIVKVRVPLGSVPYSVGEQRGVVCVWYSVPEAAALEFAQGDVFELMHLLVVNTGTPYSVPTGYVPSFLGTVSFNGIVWHVFRLTPVTQFLSVLDYPEPE